MFNFFSNLRNVDLYAPMTGKIVPIEEVPDSVFAEKMVGDGIAILPTDGKVVAPCDGKVIQIFPTNHAIGITTQYGFDVLIHVGMDTVELKGDGFKRVVEVGTSVKKGDLLIEADLEKIKSLGKNTISPFIILDADKAEIVEKYSQDATRGETEVLKVKVKKGK